MADPSFIVEATAYGSFSSNDAAMTVMKQKVDSILPSKTRCRDVNAVKNDMVALVGSRLFKFMDFDVQKQVQTISTLAGNAVLGLKPHLTSPSDYMVTGLRSVHGS